MILPKHIYNVLNSPSGFDALLLYKLKETKTAVDAYYAAVDEVRQYVPKFKEPYNGPESYKVKLHIEKSKEIYLPDDVINAAVSGIWEIYEQKLERIKVNKLAYDATMLYINKHLPSFKPYKNYNSFRTVLLLKRKKQAFAKKRKPKA
jgi:hypothetical protein